MFKLFAKSVLEENFCYNDGDYMKLIWNCLPVVYPSWTYESSILNMTKGHQIEYQLKLD